MRAASNHARAASAKVLSSAGSITAEQRNEVVTIPERSARAFVAQ
jgi:hypothetical protein